MIGQGAVSLLKHPFRLMVAGKSGSGKTTLVVDIIKECFHPQVDRIMILCPSWDSQENFDPIRKYVDRKRDVIDKFNRDPFKKLLKQLNEQKILAKEEGRKNIKTLILIDDMAGSRMLHGGRVTPFSNLAIQSNHVDLSIIVLTQQPKAITPGFRDNLEGVICYPPQRKIDRQWLFEEYNGNNLSKKKFFEIISIAWKGIHQNDYSQLGQHFIFMFMPIRAPIRYFADFHFELTPKKFTLKGNNL